MSLNSLANPLSSLALQPRTLNLPTNLLTNDPYWDVSGQYYKNDIVISPIDYNAYVWLGDSSGAQPCVLGGSDPSVGDSWWYALSAAPADASFADLLNVTVTNGASATTAKTIAGAATLAVGAGSKWLVSWSGTFTPAGTWTAPDLTNVVFTASGSGASTAVTTTVQPATGQTAAVGASGVAVVQAGTGSGLTITPTIVPFASTSQQVTVTNFNVHYSVISY
jgi:hypothetical protein